MIKEIEAEASAKNLHPAEEEKEEPQILDMVSYIPPTIFPKEPSFVPICWDVEKEEISDGEDDEIAGYILTTQEQELKTNMWNNIDDNKKWLAK